MRCINSDEFNIADYIRAGDAVICGQGTAEPLGLTQALVHAAAEIDDLSVFLGMGFSDSFLSDKASNLKFRSFGAIGTTAKLARAGRVDIIPCHYTDLFESIARGDLAFDVVLLQLSGNTSKGLNMGLANDYVGLAARKARTVIAEINADVPWCHGAQLPTDIKVDVLVQAQTSPLELQPAAAAETEQRIASHVSELIVDGAVLQLGIGSIPDAVLAGLGHHRNLGIHSGVIGDRVLDLIEKGVITNSQKSLDTGVSICGNLLGTQRLYQFANENPAIVLRSALYTHALNTLSQLDNLVALNSAIEVDLSGQVNAETANGIHLGAVGGQIDFSRGANASHGGKAIIALPSTAKHGSISRIVPQLTNVTCARSDVDLVVTEWGIANLRGASLSERAQRLINIASPEFRDELSKA